LVERGGRDSPRRATSFLVARQERRRRYAPHSLRPLRGNVRRGACGVRRGTHCAPAALRSDNHGESDREAGVSCGTPATPQAPRRRRSRKGGEAQYGPSLRSAPGPWPSAAMARVDVGQSAALLVAPAARRGWRIRARDCLSAAGASLSETPPSPSTAGCPGAQRRDADSRVAFLLGTFLWRSKEQVPRPPGRDPASALYQSTPLKMIATTAIPVSARAKKHPKTRKTLTSPTPAPA
jgi:hypothetical protein